MTSSNNNRQEKGAEDHAHVLVVQEESVEVHLVVKGVALKDAEEIDPPLASIQANIVAVVVVDQVEAI